MARSISKDTRRELVQAIAGRYRTATRIERGRILDEFVKLTNYHRCGTPYPPGHISSYTKSEPPRVSRGPVYVSPATSAEASTIS